MHAGLVTDLNPFLAALPDCLRLATMNAFGLPLQLEPAGARQLCETSASSVHVHVHLAYIFLPAMSDRQ